MSFGQDGFEIKLEFDDPTTISQNTVLDILYLQMNLSQFGDENEQTNLKGIMKKYEVPAQIGNEVEAEAVED